MKLFDEPRNRLASACEAFLVGKTRRPLTLDILSANLKDSEFITTIEKKGIIKFSRAGTGNQLHELGLLLLANPSEFDEVMRRLSAECRLKKKPQNKPRGRVRLVS